jgi:hypothetical protein
MLWRMTTSQGGLRVSEQIRSDRFQVDLSGSAAFDIVVNTLQWRLHPMANHDPGYDVGVHEGHARTEYLIYWESPQSPPLLVYTFTWADSAVAEDFSGYELNSFTVPHVEEPVYECDPNEGCVQTGTIVKASGVLWWERTASMDLVHTAEVPETGPAWLVLAGLLMTAAARVGRRGRPDHGPRPLARR